MQQPLSHTYTTGANNRAQVLKVPQYGNVTIEQDGVLTASAWDGSTGGILAFLSNGTFTNSGTIAANGGNASPNALGSGGGYRGGANDIGALGSTGHGFDRAQQGESSIGVGGVSPAANGAGGGGGGGNGAVGNAGGQTRTATAGAAGGTDGTRDLTTIVLGAGGGGGVGIGGNDVGGYGGNGGGIIFINATTISKPGSITANGGNGASGEVGSTGSGGGGGSGGSILIRTQTASGTGTISALGGTGGVGSGSSASGGIGGDGRIRIEYCDTLSVSTNPLASVQKLDCNDAPVVTDDSYEVDEDTPLTVAAPGVLDNDTDADGDALTAVLVDGPTNGELELNEDGSFTYTPNARFDGQGYEDSFTYQASDGGEEESNIATVTITVSSACTITGTEGADVLAGTSGDDVLCGLGGGDVIYDFSGGDDTLVGGEGVDIPYFGYSGNDTLKGGEDTDLLIELDGVGGNDALDGEDGEDYCYADQGDTRTNCER